MISALKGVVKAADNARIEVQVEQTGISFVIAVPTNVESTVGKAVELVTYMHWNQDNGPSLFGFETRAQREMFSIVLSCTGVGPKMALSLLNELSPEQLVQAVTTHDFKALSKVSGIGPKKAEQLVIQLHSKVKKLTNLPGQEFGGATHLNTVSDALSSLNYSKPEITQVMVHLRKQEDSGSAEFDVLMRQALAFLSKKV
ncbi:MAG TPA: Holliday junction branch migration protein RuvA [Candidatus Babeliales bacterium]|nr:Holliday junction branch migration protein RuvA [Candidatus Babeliales bacterium]